MVLAVPSHAYYHYVHYLTGSAPFIPVPEAFDLNVLPDKTVTFFVSDAGLRTYGPNDSFHHTAQDTMDKVSAHSLMVDGDVILETIRLINQR